MKDMTPHPTRYKGYLMRSRLEAKWAAFFDLLGWKWAYEPVELSGYIPDFVLRFYKPLLVEVKPCWTLEEMEAHTGKIERSGWEGEAVIVGLRPLDDNIIGLMWEPEGYGCSIGWGGGQLFRCRNCGHPSLMHFSGSYACRVDGCHFGNRYLGYFANVDDLWAQAQEITRWLPGQNGV